MRTAFSEALVLIKNSIMKRSRVECTGITTIKWTEQQLANTKLRNAAAFLLYELKRQYCLIFRIYKHLEAMLQDRKGNSKKGMFITGNIFANVLEC